MTVKVSVVNVGTSAALVVKGGGAKGSSGSIKPVAAIFVGGSDVDTTNHGWPLAAGELMNFVLEQNEELWAVASAGTTAKVLLQGI